MFICLNIHLYIYVCKLYSEITDMNKYLYLLFTIPFLVYMINTQKVMKCMFKWGKEFKNGPSQICGRQALKNFK